MGRIIPPWHEPDWWECDWCQRKWYWRGRPCLARSDSQEFAGQRESKRRECERVRMKNAAWRKNRSMPRALRRAAKIAAGAEAGDDEADDQENPCKREGDAENKNSEIKTDSTTVPADSPTTKSISTPTRSKYDTTTFEYKKTRQQRQAKACTGHKDVIHEGFGLAFGDDHDVARLLAANRKAWPRGQAPIAVNATLEDREIAELIQKGLLTKQELAVNHWDPDDAWCPYTVRFVESRRKNGRRKSLRSRRGAGYTEEQQRLDDSESDWWYLDDETFAQLLRDGELEMEDRSELSFVYVD